MTKLTYGAPQEAGMDPAQIALLHERATEWIDGATTRSAVMLAARRGKIVFHEAYGPLTDQPSSPPMQKDSIFAVSSITKVMTATAIMVLVEDGLLGLNRPLTEYFPEICGEGTDKVEIQHLLTHTSGFREEENWAHFLTNLERTLKSPPELQAGQHKSIADYLAGMADVKSHSTPGSLMHYGSHNYILLSDLVRRVSGQPVEVFVKERFFDLLGMEGTSYLRDDSAVDRQVVRGEGMPAGRNAENPFLGPENDWLATAPWGFIGANTTALDLAIWGQTMLNGGSFGDTRLLSRASVYEMTRDQLPGVASEVNDKRFEEASWGLGWAVQGNMRWPKYNSTLVPKGAFWHTGNGGSQFWVDPANEIIGVFLSVIMIEEQAFGDLQWAGDLFQNMVTAAVVD